VPEHAALLREHDVGMVIAGAAGLWPELDDVASDVAYVRLHGDRELYVSGYGAQALARWAARPRRPTGSRRRAGLDRTGMPSSAPTRPAGSTGW
jgi:uncharacterized protein YecE (DUF72 family)